jgi:hypothetical protein
MKTRFALALLIGSVLFMSALSWAQAHRIGTPGGAASESNELQLGIGAEGSYDDNTFDTEPAHGQALFSVRPHAAWNMTRRRLVSLFSYEAYVSRSGRYDFYNRTSHTFDTSLSYRWTKALTVTLNDNFVHSLDPIFAANSLESGAGTPGGVNPSFFGPPAVRTTNSLGAQANYRLNARSSLNFGSNYHLNRFSETVGGASLRNSDVISGDAGYTYDFSPRMRLGASYDVMKVSMSSGFDTWSHRALLTNDWTFRPTMTLALFAGPNYISNQFHVIVGGVSVPLSASQWTWSAGGNFTWTHNRSSLTAGATHEVNDGGGLATPVQLTSFSFSGSTHLSRKWSGSIHGSYALNNRITGRVTPTALGSSAHYGFAGASLHRNLARNLDASLSYDHMEVLRGAGTLADTWIPRNRVTIALNYSFIHPLGR